MQRPEAGPAKRPGWLVCREHVWSTRREAEEQASQPGDTGRGPDPILMAVDRRATLI